MCCASCRRVDRGAAVGMPSSQAQAFEWYPIPRELRRTRRLEAHSRRRTGTCEPSARLYMRLAEMCAGVVTSRLRMEGRHVTTWLRQLREGVSGPPDTGKRMPRKQRLKAAPSHHQRQMRTQLVGGPKRRGTVYLRRRVPQCFGCHQPLGDSPQLRRGSVHSYPFSFCMP